MQRTARLFYFLLLLSSLLLIRCANPVSPQGGPIDKTPPKVTGCDPAQNNVSFDQKNFRIDFDEFISLKNPVNEIFISPPLRNPLDTRLRGKSLVVQFDDTLAANTTYSVTFGNAIVDLTEGNTLKGYRYVFSTGAFIDSLSLKGNLASAFDRKPVKDVHIGIYIDNNDSVPLDSLPLRVVPYYITKSDENGQFIFNNLKMDKCKLFAVADQNGDLIFNQPTEKIAFLDSLMTPFYIQKVIPDSLKKTDSLSKTDSVHIEQPVYPEFTMFLFEQTDSVQRIVKSGFIGENVLSLIFRFPADNLQLTPLNFDSASPWYIPEYSANKDSVTLWITRPDTDSITLKVSSARQLTDTIDLVFEKKEKSQKKDDKVRGEQLRITQPAKGTGFNQFKNKFVITWSYPLIKSDFQRVLLIEDKDTIHPVLSFYDSLHRKVQVSHTWKEEKNYRLIIPDSSFTGLNGISHDSIFFNIRTRAEKDFGNLILSETLPEYSGTYIIQLLNEKETILYEEHTIAGPGKIRFDFMSPGKYKIKAIKDRNRNGVWDSGNYHKLIQPEEVLYLPKVVEIRSNWDVEETWN